jgi:hypothetical protein
MKIERDNKKNESGVARIMLNLDREQYEFIDKISRDTLFTAGKRLTNNKIILTFINVMKEIGISGEGLSSCEELKNRMLFILGVKKEKRAYPRLKKEVRVSWRKLDSMSGRKTGKTMDINQAGFRITLEEGRKPGEILEFAIHDSSMPDSPINVLGRIVWVKLREDEKNIEAGIQLTYVSVEDKERFNNLLCDKEEKAQYSDKQKKNI